MHWSWGAMFLDKRKHLSVGPRVQPRGHTDLDFLPNRSDSSADAVRATWVAPALTNGFISPLSPRAVARSGPVLLKYVSTASGQNGRPVPLKDVTTASGVDGSKPDGELVRRRSTPPRVHPPAMTASIRRVVGAALFRAAERLFTKIARRGICGSGGDGGTDGCEGMPPGKAVASS